MSPGARSRLGTLEGKVRGAEPVEVGGGRRIMLTPLERYETLIDAMGGFDSPTIEAIRSGQGQPDAGRFANLIHAFIGRSGPPSGDPENPWVDAGDDPAGFFVDPQEAHPE